MQKRLIEQFSPDQVFHGLLAGEGFSSRVGAACIYHCPRCRHRIRFRWQSFYQWDGASCFTRALRRRFDDMTPALAAEEQGAFDFFCPTCGAPTRIIFSANRQGIAAYQFDLYAALVGAGALT